jgi:hypothetical protein
LSKDTTAGHRLIERVEIAANIAAWDDKRKAQELASVLWVRAQVRWDYLPIFLVDKNDWNAVKVSFL